MQWNEFHSRLKYLSAKEQKRVEQAFLLGEKMHHDQKRKSGEPYFMHPIAIAVMLTDMEADADTIIAALLHDTVEDTPITIEEIERQFNGDASQIIDGLTKLDAKEMSSPCLNEQMECLRKMFTLMQEDVRIMVIKLLDRLHNMQTIEFLSPDRRITLARETQEVFVKIADRLCMLDLRDELAELCLLNLEPDKFTKLVSMRLDNEQRGQEVILHMGERLKNFDSGNNKPASLHFEHKSWSLIAGEYKTSGMVATGKSDVVIAFVCSSISDCYRMLGELHQLWRRETLSFQDFISSPTINGYRGLHTTVILEDGTRVRCKIRTREMQSYARRGITLHCFGKKTKAGVLNLLPWTRRISPLSETTMGSSDEFWESLKSEILGESITVYGPGDQAVQLPRNSTALDGIFHIFKEQALFVKNIHVNGVETRFDQPLISTVAITAEFVSAPTVRHEWLEWVKTGHSSTLIRQALAKQPKENKIVVGHQLLQKKMNDKKRGFLEEINEQAIKNNLTELGFSSLDEVYIAIAEGRITENDAFKSLFEELTSRQNKPKGIQSFLVNFEIENMDADYLETFSAFHKKYSAQITNISFSTTDSSRGTAKLAVLLSADQRQNFERDLTSTGVDNINFIRRNKSIRNLIVLLLVPILWGLDPVFARIIIQADQLSAVDFTLLRFWSLALIFMAVTAISRRRNILQPLKLRNPLLWLSSILLTLVALMTYSALQYGTATHYEILMTASGLLAVSGFYSLYRRRKLLILWVVFGFTIAFLTLSPAWILSSGIFMMMAMLFFSAFLATSTRYIRQELVSRRKLEYYTAMLTIGSICTIPFFFFLSPAVKNPETVVHVALFSVLFIGLPYYLYYEVSLRMETDSLIPLAFVMLGITFLGEFFATKQVDPFTTMAFVCMMLIAFVLDRTEKVIPESGAVSRLFAR